MLKIKIDDHGYKDCEITILKRHPDDVKIGYPPYGIYEGRNVVGSAYSLIGAINAAITWARRNKVL